MASRRLVFLYYGGEGGVNANQSPSFLDQKAENSFAKNLPTEGYFCLLKALKDLGVFDEILIFIESNRGRGVIQYENGMVCYVVPHIRWVDKFLQKGDIIWARGGWRTWFEYLEGKKGKHWLCLYAANSGRARWKFWDIIFDDLVGRDYTDKLGRLFLNFIKPTNESIFRTPPLVPKEYDICIGASHIHDKKGQWRMIFALDIIRELFGQNLKCVMPGRVLRGIETNGIVPIVQRQGLDVAMPGMISRRELALLVSKCTIFVYAGESGQNDRGPIEALCCGTPISVANTSRHHPLVWNHEYCKPIDWGDIRKAAASVYLFLTEMEKRDGTAVNGLLVRDHFDKNMSLEVISGRMGLLFYRLQETKIGDLKSLYG
jgi:hypothetical protein